jgi:hypothetical protein
MKLSKILSIALLGAVGMTNTLMASGTVAGTTISNTPILMYRIAGENKILNAPTSSYVVDKVLNFTVDLQESKEQRFVMGKRALGQFLLTNNGNSIEDFVLEGSYGKFKSFSFSSIKIYVDRDNDGILDKAEKVNTAVLKKLPIGAKRIVWIEVQSSFIDNFIGKKTDFGLMIRASSSGVNGVYKVQTAKNSISKVDIVFADGGRDDDGVRNNRAINRYIWKTSAEATPITLDKNLNFNHITADPKNGVSQSREEAKSDKFKAVVNATRVKIWEVTNSTKNIGKNIKVSIPLNLKDEKVSTTASGTWWGREERRVHIIWDEKLKRVVGVGRYNFKTKAIDFVIKEIKVGDKLYLHVVTILTKSIKPKRLNITHLWNIISADPVNGVCKDANDAKSGKYKAIPGATNIRSWEIINNTTASAKDVKFSIKIDPTVERIATTSKNTWWKNDKRVHIIYVPKKGNIGEGIYRANSNSVEFFFKEIKSGETFHPYIVTEIK